MKRIIIIILAGVLILFAQGNSSSPGRVLHLIETVSEQLEQAYEQFDGDIPENVSAYLNQAEELIEQAMTEYNNGNMTLARQLAEQSQNMINRAITMKREESQEMRQARRRLEQCRQWLEKIAPKITALADNQLTDLFARAEQLLESAQSALEKENAKLANSLAKQSFSLLRKISAKLSGGVNAEKVADVMEYTEQIIERVENEFAGEIPDEADVLLNLARELQNSANKALDRGDLRAATDLTMSARKRAQDAYKYVGERKDLQTINAIQKGIEQISSALEQLELERELSQTVQNLISDAKNALEQNNYSQANTYIERAKKLLGEIGAHSDDNPSRESVSQAIQLTDELINSISPTDETGKNLLKQANSKQGEAKQEFENGNPVSYTHLTLPTN